jgi:hypothetical protein
MVCYGATGIESRSAQFLHLFGQRLLRPGIDNRQRRGDGQTGCRSDGSGSSRSHLNDTVSEPNSGVRHRLTLSQALADELDDLKALGELAVVESITRLELGEVHDRDVGPFELSPEGLLIPEGAGRKSIQAGFGQIEAQVMKVGMVAEVTCIYKPWTVIPMVVTGVQDFIAAGQFRGGEQLVDPQQVMRPGTIPGLS